LRVLQQGLEPTPYRRDQGRSQLLSCLIAKDRAPDRQSEEFRRRPRSRLEIESQLPQSFAAAEDEVDRPPQLLPGIGCPDHEQCDAASPGLCPHPVKEARLLSRTPHREGLCRVIVRGETTPDRSASGCTARQVLNAIKSRSFSIQQCHHE
jgi:hypothetical protein